MPNDYNLELVSAHLLEKLTEENPQIAEDLKKLIEENPDFLDMIGGADVIGTLLTMEDEQFDLLQDSLAQAFAEAMQTKEFDELMITAMLQEDTTVESIDQEIDTLYYIIYSI